MRSSRRWALLVATVLLAPTPSRAQTEASRLIAQARAEIDALNLDSAFVMLERALRRAPTETERARAFTLLGITQLSRDDRVGARSAFEQALRLDGGLRVDTLADLHTDLRAVFGEVRVAMGISDAPRESGAAPRLTAAVALPADTSVEANGGVLRVEPRTSSASRVTLTVSPIDAPGETSWTDTSTVSGATTRGWNLRGRDGRIVASGRYSLRAWAVDSVGQVSATIERILIVSRGTVDTLPGPPPLGPMAPETVIVKGGSPRGFAAGLLVAVSAVALPSMLGNAELQSGASYPTSYAVAAVVSTASLIGFIRGTRLRALPANVTLNAQVRERDAAERARVVQENDRRRDAAPIRVRVEGVRP